jgi:uncharacterized membrane protein YbhN (UPF0104 family)
MLVLKIAVSVALLTFLFSKVDMAKLWEQAKHASALWMAVALAIYTVSIAAGVWRWRLLLEAQGVHIPLRRLSGSFLVALFFNNFLPSNIGGDVIRIADTVGPTRSKTRATMIVFMDRVLGLMGLVLVVAVGTTMVPPAVAGASGAALPIPPWMMWAVLLGGAAVGTPALLAPATFMKLLHPLKLIHAEWIGARIESLTHSLSNFGKAPGALAGTFAGAVFVQGVMVVYYMAVARGLGIPIGIWDLAVLVPTSFVVQMVPLSVNGFGIREGFFTLYFSRLGLPAESAVLLSLVATVLAMLFSLSGAAVYIGRGK